MKCVARSMLLALVLVLVPASAQSLSTLDVHSTTVAFPDVTVQFSIRDASGARLVGLQRSNITLTEDGTPVTRFTLESQVANADTPIQQVSLSNGEVFTLAATGTTIGIVFDATQLLNGTGSSARDSIGEGRLAIEAFLLEPGDPPPPRTLAPANPERIGLFIPVDDPGQSLQPDSLPGFTQDRYAVINALRQGLPVRQGKTNLYAAIQAAIEDTAREAATYGTEAVVLVVSDGGDAISAEIFRTLVSQASAHDVHIVAFGIGTDQALASGGFRLMQLAESASGVYLERPDASAAGAAFARAATPKPGAVYTLRYTTRIIDDGNLHPVVLNVNLPTGQLSYQFDLTNPGTTTGMNLQSLTSVLVWQYFVFAVPIALLTSLFLSLLMGLMFWREHNRSGIAGLKTRR